MRYTCAVCRFYMSSSNVATNSQHFSFTVMNMMDTRLARGLAGTRKAAKQVGECLQRVVLTFPMDQSLGRMPMQPSTPRGRTTRAGTSRCRRWFARGWRGRTRSLSALSTCSGGSARLGVELFSPHQAWGRARGHPAAPEGGPQSASGEGSGRQAPGDDEFARLPCRVHCHYAGHHAHHHPPARVGRYQVVMMCAHQQ